MKRNYPLHIHISTLFLVLIVLVGSLIGWNGYKMSRQITEVTANDLTLRISREVLGDLNDLMEPVKMAANLVSQSELSNAPSLKDRITHGLDLFIGALKNSNAMSSIYVGYDNGDFFFVRKIRDENERNYFKAPEGTQYIIQSIERSGEQPKGRYLFLDNKKNILREDDHPEYPSAYDPRTRSWYKEAQATGLPVTTTPYIFFSNRKVGTTYAIKTISEHAVIGADILLETMGESLAHQKITPNSQVALVNHNGFVIAHENINKLVVIPDGADAKPTLRLMSNFGIPALKIAEPIVKKMAERGSYSINLVVDDEPWRFFIDSIYEDGSSPIYLVMAIPDKELLGAAYKLLSTSALITILIILISVPITWIMARKIAASLRKLDHEAESIRHFDFSSPITVKSMVDEVSTLSSTMNSMKHAIQRFMDIIQAVAGEKNFDRLLPMLLKEMLDAADSKTGILYLLDKETLSPAAFMKEGDSSDFEKLPALPAKSDLPMIARALAESEPSTEILSSDQLGFFGLDAKNSSHGIFVPLFNRQKQLVGAVFFLRDEIIESAQLSFVKVLSGTAAGALETRELIKAQKDLFEAFIKLIAGAIDAKSPYTGGHCARVPVLTKMLAKAACEENTGSFKNFELGDDEWEAIHVASWLHDCGKITTPEYVVDKATKLETLYDRIHEIRMRFEVLKRDAEILSLKAVLAGADPAIESEKLKEKLSLLDDDFSFVAMCNEGGEFMAAEKIERLRNIASYTWQRTLDDRLGISYEEKLRKQKNEANPNLPVIERLLEDKDEHLFDRREQERIPEDNKWGFHMTVPKYRFNKGELYNLSVARGTLTEEERYKINEHIVQTLMMLSELPFPKHLRNVPELAGGHHEKMDGTGYPKRLKKEEMSPLARMMAIADIFEALTAIDRPYKKGKTLSEAIKIMSFMKKDKHIDSELFDLFLRSGVYLEYAKQYMQKGQIDEIYIEKYL